MSEIVQGEVKISREDAVLLYSIARRADYAESYTMDDLLADYKAMRQIIVHKMDIRR